MIRLRRVNGIGWPHRQRASIRRGHSLWWSPARVPSVQRKL